MAGAGLLRSSAQLISLKNFLPVLGSGMSRRLFAAGSRSGEDEQERKAPTRPPTFDPKYRSPTEIMWPASKHQQRFASKVHLALETALLHNDALRDGLVQRLGFAVKDVRMSPDNLKAFIQWDSITGQAGELQRELRVLAPRLRAAMASALRARNVPQLVFRHDGLTPKQQEVEDVFQRLDEEAATDAADMAPEGGDEATEGEQAGWQADLAALEQRLGRRQ